MKKIFKRNVAFVLIAALVMTLPAFSTFASDSEKAEGWYYIERFDDKSISLGYGNDVAFDSTSDASTTGWNAYYKNSKGTLYGSVRVEYNKNTPYDNYLVLNRSKSSTTSATIYTGYYDVNGYTDDEFIVDMDVLIGPAEEEVTGNYFRNTVTLGSNFGFGSPVAYVVFTTDVVDGSDERVNVVKYYDTITQTEIEIPELRNFKIGINDWYSIRFKVNNVTNTYDFYMAEGKDTKFVDAVKSGIAFNDVIIKEVFVSAFRDASDANGLYGGGVICLDNLKIGVETSQDNLYRTGKAEEKIDFEDVALNESLHDTPDASLAWDVSTRSSRRSYGFAAIEEECANRMMRLYMRNNYAATIYTSYPIASGIGAPDGITTVQFRYKSNVSDISNQNDIIQLYTDSTIANGLYNYGIHIFLHKGDVYVAGQSGTEFIVELPPVTPVDGVDKIVPQKWYTVKVVANFNNMTYDLYISNSKVDGGETPIASGLSMYKQENLSYVPADETKIRRIHFSTPYDPADSNINGKSDFCIDDLIFNPDLSADLYDLITIDSSLISEGTLGINVPLNLITYNSSFEADDISHKLVVAVYGEGNTLKAVDVNPGSFNEDAISKTVTFDPSVYEGSTVKVFLLDGLNSLLPLGSFEILS